MRILYILGAGHCGSTLLSLMLNRHGDMISVSEIGNLNQSQPAVANGERYDSSPFWMRVAEHYASKSGVVFWDVAFLPPVGDRTTCLKEWQRTNEKALESISIAAGKDIIVDASKNAKRLAALAQMDCLSIWVIYLVRDARAIVHAYDRKYKGMERGVRILRRLNASVRVLETGIPKNRWLVVRYEDLTTDVEKELARICRFIGVEFEPRMLAPDVDDFVGIGGNRMAKQPVRAITLDDAWKTDMGILKKLSVRWLFRRYSKYYGYHSWRE